MIYTITFNPSVDYYTYIETLSAGQILRAQKERLTFGGKGLNVSCVLTRLGIKNRALGFIAGQTGTLIQELLEGEQIECDLIRLDDGQSRVCVKIRAQEETDIHGTGPSIAHARIEQLYRALSPITNDDTLVIAGSIPPSLQDNTYEMLIAALPSDPRIVADTTGQRLRALLPFHPFLIKPNHHELAELIGSPVQTEDEAAEGARQLQREGARNVLVSMGAAGALLCCEEGTIFTCTNADIHTVDTVGAGDSMVAGFLAGLNEKNDMAHALRMGAAAANATCSVQGLAQRQDVLALYEKITVNRREK